MAGALPGKLISMKIGGVQIRCQTDITLNIVVNTTDNDPCKPSEEEAANGASQWVTRTIDTKEWSASATAKTFADVTAGFIDNGDITALMLADPTVEVTIGTTQTTDYNFPELWVYEGTGILTNFTLNGAQAGESTYDIEISGSGELTYTATPFTT